MAPGPPAASRERVRESVNWLENRDRTLNSVSTEAVMEYRSGEQRVKARERIVAARPGLLRIEALSPLGVAAVVAAHGSELEVYTAGNDTLVRAPATAEALGRFARIPMAPGSAVALLMGLPPPGTQLSLHPIFAVRDNDFTLIGYPADNGTEREFGFGGGELRMVRERGRDRHIRYEVRYSDYRNIGALMFPYRVEADFPATSSSINLRYERPIVDVAVSPSLFVLKAGPKTRELRLRDTDGAPLAPTS
jgi:hypothetical protein